MLCTKNLHVFRRYVKLELLFEIPDEVTFGLEPAKQLMRHESSFFRCWRNDLLLLLFNHLKPIVDFKNNKFYYIKSVSEYVDVITVGNTIKIDKNVFIKYVMISRIRILFFGYYYYYQNII